jgi:drug/metabolite transporter (DMT)-like permease
MTALQERTSGHILDLSEKAVAICANCVAAVTMLMVNKFAVQALPYPIILVLAQNSVTLVVVLATGLYCGRGHRNFGFRVSLTAEVVRMWFPAMCLFITMLCSSLFAMKTISVPSVLVFRALTPLVTSSIAVPVLGHRPTRSEWGSLLLIVIGAFCYLGTDPQVSPQGYVWMTVNLFAASTYVVYVKRSINYLQPTTNDLMLFNNLLSIPLLVILVPVFDNPAACLRQLPLVTSVQWMPIMLSLFCAGFIAFTGFLLQAAVHPTTTVIINHLTKVFSFVMGAILFKKSFAASMVVGALITLAGTIWYSHESQKPRSDNGSGGGGNGGGGGGGGGGGDNGSSRSGHSSVGSVPGSKADAPLAAVPLRTRQPDEETGLLSVSPKMQKAGYQT